MSDKDFVHVEAATHESKYASTASNPKPILIATLATTLVIISFSAGFFMGEKHGVETAQTSNHESLLATLHEQQKENKALKQEAQKYHQQKSQTSQVGELTFYNELPNQSIIPEPLDGSAKAVIPKHATISNPKAIISNENDDIQAAEQKLNAIIAREISTSSRKYRLQIASFMQQSDALALVAQLKNSGIEASVQRVELVKLGTRYRVNTAFFDQRQETLKAKELVKQKFNINGIIITE